MNKIFKIMWNQQIQAFVVTSELSRTKGNTSSITKQHTKKLHNITLVLLSTLGLITTNSAVAVDNTAGAGTASTSIAVGPTSNTTDAQNAIAIGTDAKVNQTTGTSAANAISIGNNASVNIYQSAYDAARRSRKARYTGMGSIAAGSNATVYGSHSIAAGENATASGWKTTAIGAYSNAEGDGSIAIGDTANTEGNNNIAFGTGTKNQSGTYYGSAQSGNATAIGNSATTISAAALAVGNGASATGLKSIAIGNDARTLDVLNAGTTVPAITSTVNTLRSQYTPAGKTMVFISEDLANDATSTIAIGDESRAVGWGSTALGTKAYALNDRTTSLGDDSKALGYASSSLGTGAYTFGQYSAAIGTRAEAIGDRAIAVGTATSATGNGSFVAGYGAAASGENAIAIGSTSKTKSSKAWYTTGGGSKFNAAEHDVWNASGDNSIAFGTDTQATKTHSIAVGTNATTTSQAGIAIGADAISNIDGAVALGNQSTTTAGVNTNSATVGSLTYSGFAGSTASSVVSVGSSSYQRQIQNVAAGQINNLSTDAINGSQLYAVIATLGNVTTSLVKVLGGDAAISNDGTISMTNIGDTSENTIHDAIKKSGGNSNQTPVVKAGKNITVAQSGNTYAVATTDDMTVNSITAGDTVINNNGLTINGGPSVTKDGITAGDTVINNNGLTINGGPSVTKDGINAGNKRITNVAPGVNGTDAVNVNQLNEVRQDVNGLKSHVHKMDRKLRAGIAGALASGGLYHATMPGKSMVAAGAGTYRGESAIAVGYSRLSDNGKLGVKFSVNSDTRGDTGAAASVGYQW